MRQAKDIALAWIQANGPSFAGFEGAFFHGSINCLNDDDSLPPSSDVDIYLVSSADPLPRPPRKLMYQGVVLEISTRSINALSDPQEILRDHKLAGTFSRDSVAVDITGQLRRLNREVAQEYHKRRWVQERCEKSLSVVHEYLNALQRDMAFYEQVTVLAFGTGNLADLSIVAGLKNPTVRKKYAVAREVLTELQRTELYETLLRLFGCADFTSEQVSHHLDQLSQVFDAACEVDKPGYRFAGDISASSRAIAIEGSRELVEAGHHRDAVFWLVATYSRCMAVFDQFGSPEALTKHRALFDELLADLGIDSWEKRLARRNLVQQEIPAIWGELEKIIDENPLVTD